MNRKDFGHNVVIPLSQLIKKRNDLMNRINKLISKTEKINDDITSILDKEHSLLMEFLPDPPKDSIIKKALDES
jgi:hypothetical protein